MDTIRETADKYQPLFNLMSEEHGLTLTISEMDDIIAKVDEVKQLFIPVVSKSFNSEEEILSFIYRNIPIAIKPKRKSKYDLINPFTSNNAFEEVCKGISKKLYKKLFNVC